ncbi:hypothetical protein IscW_ISCW010194 [Ixodes scapularis]|uniref:Uncharacterized protein n=1 Tax=Ixodes scapularis TaxID=6945 RepID=B7Q020_IXOSC|nr:hypothetical protein IscW_ISCW010194 [Ixodes scapularis]|eukprot:XP_002406732.1 hypothetical protein IscW_ISCW010194 [Ixodes scapularis]
MHPFCTFFCSKIWPIPFMRATCRRSEEKSRVGLSLFVVGFSLDQCPPLNSDCNHHILGSVFFLLVYGVLLRAKEMQNIGLQSKYLGRRTNIQTKHPNCCTNFNITERRLKFRLTQGRNSTTNQPKQVLLHFPLVHKPGFYEMGEGAHTQISVFLDSCRRTGQGLRLHMPRSKEL